MDKFLLGGPFAAIGLIYIVQGVRKRIAGKQSLAWPTTDGVILESRVEGKWSGVRGSGRSLRLFAKVTYSYTVAGTEYKGNRIRFGSEADHNAIVNRYVPDASVDVAYNPNKPSESVLEPGQDGTEMIQAGIGILFLVVGALVLIYG